MRNVFGHLCQMSKRVSIRVRGLHLVVSLPEANTQTVTPQLHRWLLRLAVFATLATRVAFGDQLLDLLASSLSRLYPLAMSK